MIEKLVIIGNGMAPGRMLEHLFEQAPGRYDVTIFNAEPRVNYDRIMLSPVLSGEKTYEQIVIHGDGWYIDHGITLYKGHRIVAIDRNAKTVTSDHGVTESYDKLVIATGSVPFIIPVPGKDLPGVITYRDLDDVEAMLLAAQSREKAIVIGGGLLGLEAAAGLAQRGMDVTVLHVMPTLMERQLDPAAGYLLQRAVEERGIKVICKANTKAIIGRDKVEGVELDNGTIIPATLVVMAVGIRPSAGLAKEAGLAVNRGIVVDAGMQTSDGDIYSIGECAEVGGMVYGLVAPLYEMARVAASHLAGDSKPGFVHSDTPTKLKVTGIDLYSLGDFADGDDREEIVLRDATAGVYKRLVLKDTRIYHGTWRHPRNQLAKFNDFETWANLVKKLEDGRFDAIFFADILGIDPAYDGKWDAYFEQGLHMPCNDTFTLCAALAGVTKNLGLVFTSSILSEHPFAFAKKASTLDHISGGRIGWNIVTSVTDNAARNFGHDKIVPHDQRYDWADEYMDVLYKLFEGSWEAGAMVADREKGVFSDHTKVHRINHVGDRYKVQGPHLVAPSPQRTPMLYQAGASKRGSQFAAEHAEGTFILYPNVDGARIGIAGTKKVAEQVGRGPEDLKFIQGLSFVVGSTMEEANQKAAEIDEWVLYEGLAAHVSRDMGVDLSHLDPDKPVDESGLDGLQGYARMIEMGKPNGEKATVKEVANALSYNCRIVGTPDSIADELERWQDAGVDGVNMICQLHPETYVDFIDHVTPVLQERGLAQREYGEGPLRQKLFGRGPLLPDNHPGAARRNAFSNAVQVAAE